MSKAVFAVLSMVWFGGGCSNNPTGAGGLDGGGTSPDLSTSAAGCPTVTLGTSLPLTYNGNTSGKPNLVKSVRLEWDTAPDDALLFVAPSAGTYAMALTNAPPGCGASAQDFQSMAYYSESTCPAPGSVASIDGIYSATTSTGSDVTLTQGQHILILFSCPTWGSMQSGSYTLTIAKH